MTDFVLSRNGTPTRAHAGVLNRALSLLSILPRKIARSWMDWSKFEYELFRARMRAGDPPL